MKEIKNFLDIIPLIKLYPLWAQITIVGCIMIILLVLVFAPHKELSTHTTNQTAVSFKPDIVVSPPRYNYALHWIQDTNIQPIIEPYSRDDQPDSNMLYLQIKNIGSLPCKNIKIEWKINVDKIIKNAQNNYILNKYNLKISNSPKAISLTKNDKHISNTWTAPFNDTALTKIKYLVSTPSNKEAEKIHIPIEIEWIYLIGVMSMVKDINKEQRIECPIIEMVINGEYSDNRKLEQRKHVIRSRFVYIPPEVAWDKTKMRSDNIPIYQNERPKDMIRGILVLYEVE